MSVGAPGSKTFTVRGAVGSSDSSGVANPVIVWDVSLVGGGTNNAVQLYSGAESTGTYILQAWVLANSENLLVTNGIRFNSGCYVHFRTLATATTATITFNEEPA